MRHCNGCTMCCTEMAQVTPKGVACHHECAIGCEIHGNHPDACQSFACGWLQGLVDEQYKPDVVGWLLDMRENITPMGTMKVGFAIGPRTEGQREACRDGMAIVSQDGQLFTANKEDENAYHFVSQLLERMRMHIHRCC